MTDIRKLCGAVPSPADARDYTVCAAAEFPESFVLDRLPAIKRQTAGSCVAHSCAYLFEYLFGERFGVGFTYGYRPADYTQNAGMIPREAANTAVKLGNILFGDYGVEAEMPEMKRLVDARLPELVRLAALRKAACYVRCKTAADIKTQLTAHHPVMCTAAISQTRTDKNGIFPCTGCIYGYHQMSIWGWERINGKEYFLVANSWGEKWGRNGFCFVSPEDALRVGDVIAFSLTPTDPTIKRTLKLGMRGDDVLALENRLNQEKGITLCADGCFTAATERAVRLVQRRLGLPVSGTVGTQTWEALGL